MVLLASLYINWFAGGCEIMFVFPEICKRDEWDKVVTCFCLRYNLIFANTVLILMLHKDFTELPTNRSRGKTLGREHQCPLLALAWFTMKTGENSMKNILES